MLMTSALVDIIGASPFTLSFVAVFIWCYTYLFNHKILLSYSGGLNLRQNEVNDFIKKNINENFSRSLLNVSLDEGNDDEVIINDNTFKHPYRPREIVIRIIFSIAVTFSVQLIILLMSELINFTPEGSRELAFHLTINFLVLTITIVQPFLFFSLMVSRDIYPSKNPFQVISICLMLLGWLYMLHKFGDISQSFTPSRSKLDTKSLIEIKINEISIAGITTLAILSGVGSSSKLYKLCFLNFTKGKTSTVRNNVYGKQEITESGVNQTIQSLNHTMSLLNKRRAEFSRLQNSNGGTIYEHKLHSNDNIAYNKKQKIGSLLHKVQSFASLSTASKEGEEMRELEKEIFSLELVWKSVYDDLLKQLFRLHQQLIHEPFKNSLSVILIKRFDFVFALYCAYRICNVVVKLFWTYFVTSSSTDPDSDESNGSSDPLAITITKLISSIIELPFSEGQLLNQVSFVLSASLFVCSFSNVQATFKSFGKLFPRLNRISNLIKIWLKHLIISELLGVYVISTALLIRTNLPSNLSHQLSRILSLSGSSKNSTQVAAREVQFIERWFDKVFAFTCIYTFLHLYVRDVVLKDYDDDASFDEEAFVENEAATFKLA